MRLLQSVYLDEQVFEGLINKNEKNNNNNNETPGRRRENYELKAVHLD